jgi:type II secretion system protein H
MGPLAGITLLQGARKSASPNCCGFTLLEVIIVVFIVGVMGSVLAISLAPADAATTKKEANRLAGLLDMALADARSSGQSIAWVPERKGYAFWQQGEDGEWSPFPAHSVFRPRTLEGSVELRDVRIDASTLPPGGRVAIPPYGLRSRIEATLAGGSTLITLRGNALGRISTHRTEAARVYPD